VDGNRKEDDQIHNIILMVGNLTTKSTEWHFTAVLLQKHCATMQLVQLMLELIKNLIFNET